MKKLIASLLMMAAFSTACASESKMKLDVASDATEKPAVDRDVAQVENGVVPVERPESLKYDSKDYKKHKEYLRYIETHDKK